MNIAAQFVADYSLVVQGVEMLSSAAGAEKAKSFAGNSADKQELRDAYLGDEPLARVVAGKIVPGAMQMNDGSSKGVEGAVESLPQAASNNRPPNCDELAALTIKELGEVGRLKTAPLNRGLVSDRASFIYEVPISPDIVKSILAKSISVVLPDAKPLAVSKLVDKHARNYQELFDRRDQANATYPQYQSQCSGHERYDEVSAAYGRAMFSAAD